MPVITKIAKSISLNLSDYRVNIYIPMGLAFTLGYFHATPIIGIPVLLALSLTLFYIFHVLTKSDVRTSLDLLPDSIGKPFIDILNKL
jgi:hypothetical protein